MLGDASKAFLELQAWYIPTKSFTKTFALKLALKQHIPWRIKIAAKILLKRIPLNYAIWRRLRLFKHGAMESPEYAFDVFRTHFCMARLGDRGENIFVGLELGPGDSLFSALIARAFGSSKTYLVDVQAFARRDLVSYRKM